MEAGKEFLVVQPTSAEQQHAQQQKYFLFEFPEDVHKRLEDGAVFVASGASGDDAVLCVTPAGAPKEEKFLLKVCDTSNTLLVSPAPDPGQDKLNVVRFENYIECLQHVK